MFVVSLVGAAGAGKDTIADTGVAFFTEHGLSARRIALADRLYTELSEIFSIPEARLRQRETKNTPTDLLSIDRCADKEFRKILLQDHKTVFSPRRVAQLYGTEYRRNNDENYFVRPVKNAILTYPEVDVWFIPDVRFVNEDRLFPDSTETWRTIRPNLAGVDAHSSEEYWKTCRVEREFINDADLDSFTANIRSVLLNSYLSRILSCDITEFNV